MSVAALPGPQDEPRTLATAVRLAAGLPAADAVPALLELLAWSTGADTLELTGPGVAALHGAPVTLVGSGRAHPVSRAGSLVATLTLHGGVERPAVTEAVSDLLALALTADPAVVEAVLAETEADLDLVAGRLHDGPAQDAVAARYTAVLAARGRGGPDDVCAAVDAIGATLREVVTGLRSRAGEDLAAAVLAGPSRRPGVSVDVFDDLPSCPAGATALATRLLDAAVAPAGGHLTLLPCADGGVAAVVTALAEGHAADVAARHLARARALGLQVVAEPTTLRLRIPAAGTSRKDMP